MRWSAGQRLNALLAEAGIVPLDAATLAQFEVYISLILRWNTRLNLTSVRDESTIISNHLVESIACARALPDGVGILLDYGSGAGLPGIPIALCRTGISVTLAESQSKKAAFLQEVVRVLGIGTKVHAARAESLTGRFDCITLRAVDKMPKAVAAATRLVVHGGWLALMATRGDLTSLRTAAGPEFTWNETLPLPFSENRILALGRLLNSQV